jgi:hypothetical protein
VNERGQASVELLAGLPVLLALGAFLLQLFAVGYSAVLAGNAAEAGALALAAGGDAGAAAREGLPGWSRAGLVVHTSRGLVEVTLHPPSPLPAVRKVLVVHASAAVDR